MTDLLSARHARAVAFVKQGLKPGKPWSSLTYIYDTPEQPAEGNEDHERQTNPHNRARRPEAPELAFNGADYWVARPTD